MTRVTLYSRPGCHLCDEMKAVVRRVGLTVPLALTEIDVSTDAGLEARYGLEIPVLEVDGRRAAKYRISDEDLRKVIAGRTAAGAPDRPDGSGG